MEKSDDVSPGVAELTALVKEQSSVMEVVRRDVRAVRDLVDDFLFRATSLETAVESVRAEKPTEQVKGGVTRPRKKKRETGISSLETLMAAKFPHLSL